MKSIIKTIVKVNNNTKYGIMFKRNSDMRKVFVLTISSIIFSLSSFGQTDTHNLNAETKNGTKLIINTSELKELVFDKNELYLSGSSLDTMLINIQSTIDGLNNKIIELQSDVQSLKNSGNGNSYRFNERFLIGDWYSGSSIAPSFEVWSNMAKAPGVGEHGGYSTHWIYNPDTHVLAFEGGSYAFTIKALSNRILSAEWYSSKYGTRTDSWHLGNSYGIDPNYSSLIIGTWLSDNGQKVIVTENSFQFIDPFNEENNISGNYSFEVVENTNQYGKILLNVGDKSYDLNGICGGKLRLDTYIFYYQE